VLSQWRASRDWSLGLSPRGEGLNFSFDFIKPVGYEITRTTLVDGAWIDTRPATWFETIAGYTRWADTNNIIVLFPQTAATPFNPQGCWDWWGYTGREYLTRKAPQIVAVRRMVEQLAGARAPSRRRHPVHPTVVSSLRSPSTGRMENPAPRSSRFH
jgi:poly(3-hydroxybutyrate) depolymerase